MTKLTSRDFKIFWSCADCQILTTSQIMRWLFEGTSLRNVQKRLRKLADAGYLDAIQTRVATDNLILLGHKGEAELRKKGWKQERKKEAPKDLDHHLGIVDIRIAIEQGLKNFAGMKLRYFYAYWQLGQFQWSYPIIPDALFSIRNAYVASAAVEFDRGLYSLVVFAKKLLQYRALVRTHPLSSVVLVAAERDSIEKLRQGLREVEALIPLRIIALEDLCKGGLGATIRPEAGMPCSRTLAEQLEIDSMRSHAAKRPL
jgi:hypothetical protein